MFQLYFYLTVLLAGAVTAAPNRNTSAAVNGRNCGYTRYGTASDKIVGGHNVRPNEFPWLVSLWMDYPKYQIDAHLCGGTLIHPRYILTAAHCTIEFGGPEFENPQVWKALIAPHDLTDISPPSKFVKIEKIVTHDFGILSKENDIAIWKLAEPVTVDEDDWTVNTLCLPDIVPASYSLDLSKLQCTVAGFGALKEDGAQPTILQAVELPVISREKCRQFYPFGIWKPRKIHDSNVCAGFEEGAKDACQGDSGGPFMCLDPRIGRYFLGGVVSWGNGCARAKNPGVFTDPRAFLGWIREKVAQMESE